MGPIAAGAGELKIERGGELFVRIFSFAAIRLPNGTVTGQAQHFNQFNGTEIHIAIDCVEVENRTTLTLSGLVTYSTQPGLVGHRRIFRVQDNGPSHNSEPDRISFILEVPTETSCADLKPALDLELVNGDIYVFPQ